MNATSTYAVTDREDKDRIKFLYAPFPADKNVNPKHWESKVNFWSTEITKLSRFDGNICLSYEVLKEKFRDPDSKQTPSGLMVVLRELYNTGQLCLMSGFSYLIDDSWGQWGYNIAHKSTSWFWRKMVYGGLHEQTKFVMKELLEENAIALLDAHYKTVKYEKTDNIVPWNVIKTVYKISGKNISEDDLICVIGYLKRSGKCKVAVTENGDKIVKFKQKTQKTVDVVSEADFETVKLKKAIAKLSIECKQIDAECERLQTQAQNHVKNKEKDKAKRVLAEKKKLTKTANLKHDALFSIKEHLHTVQESETNKMITDAFDSSATLLNHAYRKHGLTVDAVEEVMERTAEANEIRNDVEEAISTGLRQFNNDIDMDELERELNELEVGKSDDIEDELSRLPKVPSEIPAPKIEEATHLATQVIRPCVV
ncbi:charged multivesicular body protein 7-like [Hydractinia symbiolongicarpus]|uniref:charged multivesicular body protein 7-like n=1 Tax=Hydractinia symbiolongicarpus TaxID=13093 RepID=UPI00254EE5AA|nr:charged multivesicular body protein 7-like [Hydractinia symbiolongicarpus]